MSYLTAPFSVTLNGQPETTQFLKILGRRFVCWMGEAKAKLFKCGT